MTGPSPKSSVEQFDTLPGNDDWSQLIAHRRMLAVVYANLDQGPRRNAAGDGVESAEDGFARLLARLERERVEVGVAPLAGRLLRVVGGVA